MSSSSVGPLLLWIALGQLAGCHPPPAVHVSPEIPADCPEPPEEMSSIEEETVLRRAGREARANLMARLEGAENEAFATLHPPELALLEDALAAPNQARNLDPAWLREHLFRAEVEVYSPTPLGGIEDDPRSAVLSDEKGRRYHPTYVSVRRDSQGWSYRFALDPRAIASSEDHARRVFQLTSRGKTLTASWGLSRQTLESLDSLPIVFRLAQLRELRLAKWSLVAGDRAGAKGALEELRGCAPHLEEVGKLVRRLSSEPAAIASEELHVESSGLSPSGGADLGYDPSQLSLRAGLLGRLVPLAAAGVVSADSVRAAQRALRSAAITPARAGGGRELARALHRFDALLAELLVQSLEVTRSLQAPAVGLTCLKVTGAPTPTEEDLIQELDRRLAVANSAMVPRWTDGPALGPGAPSEASAWRIAESWPVLEGKNGRGERVLSSGDRRLGPGWLHLGLPKLDYRVTYADRGAAYWRGRLESKTKLADLRAAADQLLSHAVYGTDEEAAALAIAGIAEQPGRDARGSLLPLTASASPPLAAAALRALASTRSQEISAALQRSSRSSSPVVRAAVMAALGQRGLSEERGILRAGLDDQDQTVAGASLAGLLKRSDPDGIRRAREWLAGTDERRRQLVLGAVAGQRGAQLTSWAKDLQRLLVGPQTTPLAIRAAARVPGAAMVAALTRLYQQAPELRGAIIEEAEAPALEKMLLRAAAEEKVELRRRALLKLARGPRPPAALLDRAASEEDRGLRLAAQVGLTKLGRSGSLLALGEGARGTCEERAMVLEPLSQAMDAASRRRLLLDALRSDCTELASTVWRLAIRFHPEDPVFLRELMMDRRGRVRVQAALIALGVRSGAAVGELPCQI